MSRILLAYERTNGMWSLLQVVSGSDVVVLAVKPDVIPAVLKEIEQYLTEDSLVVSIAAGVPLSVLEQVSDTVCLFVNT